MSGGVRRLAASIVSSTSRLGPARAAVESLAGLDVGTSAVVLPATAALAVCTGSLPLALAFATGLAVDDGEPFRYRDGVLHIGGLPVDRLASAAGTPLYLYDLDAVAAAYRHLEAAFRPGQLLSSV
jgi:hypothetical protein